MVDPGASSRASFPNAKINVGLQVIEKRPDGFHNLDSLFVPVPWSDTLELSTPGTDPVECTLHVSGSVPPGKTEDNLVMKAYALLAQKFDLPGCDFHLIKSIPAGAGLGGGSADGAFALCLLNDHFQLGLNTHNLEALAAQLGSDCPFFIRNTPARVTGRGENIDPIELDLAGWHVVLIHPGVHVPTGTAFSLIQPRPHRPGLDSWAGTGPNEWGEALTNDFTKAISDMHPPIAAALAALKKAGAVYVDMSGSGSTVFGFFEASIEGHDALQHLPRDWRIWHGQYPD